MVSRKFLKKFIYFAPLSICEFIWFILIILLTMPDIGNQKFPTLFWFFQCPIEYILMISIVISTLFSMWEEVESQILPIKCEFIVSCLFAFDQL